MRAAGGQAGARQAAFGDSAGCSRKTKKGRARRGRALPCSLAPERHGAAPVRSHKFHREAPAAAVDPETASVSKHIAPTQEGGLHRLPAKPTRTMELPLIYRRDVCGSRFLSSSATVAAGNVVTDQIRRFQCGDRVGPRHSEDLGHGERHREYSDIMLCL